MNAAVSMQSCPDPETLSAFIDQQLDAKSRLEVVKHLAECGDCRDLVVAANEYIVENEAQPGEVVRGRFGKRWIVPLVAAAAMVVVLFGIPSIRERLLGRNYMKELVEAAGGLPKRPVEGRLSANFAYGDFVNPRGARDNSIENAQWQVQAAAWNAVDRATKKRTPTNLHASGVALIFLRQFDKDVSINDAIRDLEEAAKASPQSAAILNDLAAAYIARGTDRDYSRALEVANDAWALEQTSVTAWNRALALTRLDRRHEAISAWSEYLKLDPNSKWSEEVKEKHLRNLQER
jgi:hypothetical protein